MMKCEAELAVPGTIERLNRKSVSITQMIAQYLDEYEEAWPLGNPGLSELPREEKIGTFWVKCFSTSS